MPQYACASGMRQASVWDMTKTAATQPRIPRDERSTLDLSEEFERGVDDYWAGKAPTGWDGPEGKSDPYLLGWNMAAEQENQIGWFSENEEPC